MIHLNHLKPLFSYKSDYIQRMPEAKHLLEKYWNISLNELVKKKVLEETDSISIFHNKISNDRQIFFSKLGGLQTM